MTILVWDGTDELPAELHRWDGTNELTAQLAQVPRGVNNLTHLINTEAFAVTHRCGTDWAEYSKRALTESVFRGVDAIEVSLARTVDGVWFGLHDEDLNRTSGGTFPPAEQMTWAEVQENLCSPKVDSDPAFGPQPYVEFQDLIRPYVNSHCLFLDMKYQANTQIARDEILGMLENLYDKPRDRVVFKYAAGDNTPYAEWARANGYITWGHFWPDAYTADPVQVLADAEYWDWLGIDPAAPAQMWIDFIATGKPLLGAVIETESERDFVLGQGVRGYMSSAIRLLQGAPVI